MTINIYNTQNARTRSVIKGFITANRGTYDYSEGAYFWDGEDIKNDGSVSDVKKNWHRDWGFVYSDPNHDIYDTKNVLVRASEKNPKYTDRTGKTHYYSTPDIHNPNLPIVETYNHKLDSTVAFGGTIFWKLCEIYKEISRNKDYP